MEVQVLFVGGALHPSYQIQSCMPKSEGLYNVYEYVTRVSDYADWIENNRQELKASKNEAYGYTLGK